MNKILSLIFVAISVISYGQAFDNGFPYQMQLTSSKGHFINNSNIKIRVNVRSKSLNGNIEWQEDHELLTNDFGHAKFIIGIGTSTGLGSSTAFNTIKWEDGIFFLEILLDEENSGTFSSLINSQIFAVPFAIHSKTSDQQYSIGSLINVDTTGIKVGDILKWNGNMWIPNKDNVTSGQNGNDTVLFANNGLNSTYSDTANYAINCKNILPVDTAYYSNYSDTSKFALQALTATHSDSAKYADTAKFSLYSIGNWSKEGDSLGNSNNFLGSTDSTDLIIKTKNIERMRFTADGKIGIGTSSPLADFHLKNNNGIVFTGTYGQGTIPIQGAGSRMMWYPKKAAFRAGSVSSNIWDDSQIGDYSFATGYNTRARGDYSAAFGFQSAATGDYSFASGYACISSGDFTFSSGESSLARGPYSISLGRAAQTGNGDTAAIAIGYHPFANAKYAMAFGNYTQANQPNSFAFGYKSIANHEGSFIYSDQSVNGQTFTTAKNQFMIKASGGTIIYSNATLTTGVSLPAGGGAWSSLSDKNMKENIEPIDKSFFLNQLDSIQITKWNYITQDKKIKHIGPMAQDFHKYFKIGNDPTKINSLDFDGINLLLIQAVYEKTVDYENQEDKLIYLDKELKKLKEERQELEKLVNQLEKKYTLILKTN